ASGLICADGVLHGAAAARTTVRTTDPHAAVAADLDRGCGQRGDATAVADEAAAAGSGSCATGDVHAARTAGGYGDSRGSGRTRERDGQIGAGCCLADAAAIAAIAGGCRVAAVA